MNLLHSQNRRLILHSNFQHYCLRYLFPPNLISIFHLFFIGLNQFVQKFLKINLRDVPLGTKDSMSLLVKCTFDPTGWSQDEITKTTDTHMNSKDGYGVFNWRMKFDISVPCEFPRLKFEV